LRLLLVDVSGELSTQVYELIDDGRQGPGGVKLMRACAAQKRFDCGQLAQNQVALVWGLAVSVGPSVRDAGEQDFRGSA